MTLKLDDLICKLLVIVRCANKFKPRQESTGHWEQIEFIDYEIGFSTLQQHDRHDLPWDELR
jgi:hypothetical protein